MKRREYKYKNFTFILTPTFDEDSGLKLVEVLPCCSLYVVGSSYGVSLSWLIFEVIIHRENH
jgi:hypothetical protein